jgi:hypothetical protein
MAAFAVVTDLEARWRPLSPQEQTTATTLLEDASATIRAEVPDVDTRLTAGTLDAGIPLMVACAMVKRAMLAGDAAGVTNQQESVGPFMRGLTFANPTGDLYLTKRERRMLGAQAGGAFAIDMIPPQPDPLAWLP